MDDGINQTRVSLGISIVSKLCFLASCFHDWRWSPKIHIGHPQWDDVEALSLEQAGLRSAVLTSAMAPGINSYVFANMYGAARRVAASAVLFSTSASIITVWGWLYMLP